MGLGNAFENFIRNDENASKKEGDPVSKRVEARQEALKMIQEMIKKDPGLLAEVKKLEEENPELTDGVEKAA